MIIRRDDYLTRLIQSKHTHSIKVVTGVEGPLYRSVKNIWIAVFAVGPEFHVV